MDLEECRQLVARYLTCMEQRDLSGAAACLAVGAVLLFPGGKEYSHPREVVEGSRNRYRWVRKTIDRWDMYVAADGKAVIYCIGTLYGEALDGTPFEDVRFVDRFEVLDGRIVRQEVWNDLAEAKVVHQGS